MSTATEPDLHLIELRAENWKRYTSFHMLPDGKHAVISGKNTAGKTSVLDALETLLCGANSRKIPDPIRRGESRAVLVADLGDLIVRRTITADKGQTLEVRAADGSKLRTPQQILDKLRGNTFDLIAFLDARPQDQVDAVLSVCKVVPPTEEVEKATGEEWPARPGESADAYLARLSADDTGLYFVRRRDAGRVLDQKRKALAEASEVVARFGEEAGSEASTSDLLEKIQQVQAREDARRLAESEARDARDAAEEAQRKLKGLETDLHVLTERVLTLERQLEDARAQQKATADRITRGREVVTEARQEAETLSAEAAKYPDLTHEMTQLRQQLRQAEATQSQRAKRQAAVEQENRLTLEEQDAATEHARFDAILSRLRYLRAHLLDNVDLGIPGLEVGHGELRLNGLSLRSASTAELLTVAVAVATRQQSRLKVLWLDACERLDQEHRTLLLKLATEAGWQVLMTVVSEDEEPRVEIVEGTC